jgi:hypothetical protein
MSQTRHIRPEPRNLEVLCPYCSVSDLAILHMARNAQDEITGSYSIYEDSFL